ncbi:MAG TPA: hydantoinase/oxoprolinase N-terminal domain-containing protein, partial [Gemmatimonadaceae bacterium]|nr:hydantoinase/oxoprolinase N-terminal domain-containing protein [Gemmatimonadaceae bacterium]
MAPHAGAAGQRQLSTHWRVGVDVGGTFTDRAAIGNDGRVVAHKVLSTPGDQGEGVVRSLDGLATRPDAIVHGTTVVTNLLLERRGARVLLVTTAGAEDLLELRRQDRAALYDLSKHHPAPLVKREDVIGVRERLVVRVASGGAATEPAVHDATGVGVSTRDVPSPATHTRAAPSAATPSRAAPSAATPLRELALDPAELDRVTHAALARDPEIVLVALLHSYADASHERAIADALRAARPGLEVVTSAEVLPEIREYERFATAS